MPGRNSCVVTCSPAARDLAHALPQVWLAALEALVACTAPLQRFLDRLLTALSGLALGPLTVRRGPQAQHCMRKTSLRSQTRGCADGM